MLVHRLDFLEMALTYLGNTDGDLSDLYENILDNTKNGASITLLVDLPEETYLKIMGLLTKVTVVAPEDEPDFVKNVELIASLIESADTLGDDFCRTNFRGLCRAWYQIAMQHQDKANELHLEIAKLQLEIAMLTEETSTLRGRIRRWS